MDALGEKFQWYIDYDIKILPRDTFEGKPCCEFLVARGIRANCHQVSMETAKHMSTIRAIGRGGLYLN